MKRNVISLILAAALVFACISFPGIGVNAASGTWESDSYGWWYSYTGGGCPKCAWEKIDGYWYYFDADGYMDYSGYRDGYWLGADGSWNSAYSGGYWASNSTGWWYTDSSGWYPVSTWLKIDGRYFYFKDSGYMARNEWVDGCYVGSDGAWISNYLAVKTDLCDGTPDDVKYSFSTDKADAWQTAYYNQVKTAKSKGGGAFEKKPMESYFLCDAYGDNIPELFIRFGTCEADRSIVIYTYENDSIRELYSTGAGHTSYYSVPGGDGYMTVWAHEGYYRISKLSYYNGTFNSTELINEKPANGESYKGADDFVSGAKALTESKSNNSFAIASYMLDNIPTGSADKNEEAKAKIQSAMDNNEKVYLSYSDGTSSDKGSVKYAALSNKGYLNKNTSLLYDHTSWGDLNGDGQEECLVVYKSNGNIYNGSAAVFSYQNGQVYVYSVSDSDTSMYIENGMIVMNKSYGTVIRGIKFYKNMAEIYYND